MSERQEEPEPEFEHHASGQRARLYLAELADKIAALDGKPGKVVSGEGKAAHAFWEVHRVSNRLSRLGAKRWTSKAEELWGDLLDACADLEMEVLQQLGLPPRKAKSLIRRSWARWESAAKNIVVSAEPSNAKREIPVLEVMRDNGFRIHNKVFMHLQEHPWIAKELSALEKQSPREEFQLTFDLLRSIAAENDLEEWYDEELMDLDGVFPEQLETSRKAAECLLAASSLRMILFPPPAVGPDTMNGSSQEEADAEELGWLAEAKEGDRLWELLNAAVELGQCLENYAVFHDGEVYDNMRKKVTDPGGKQPGPDGEAVERIVFEYLRSTGTPPSPTNILKWLGGKKHPKNDGLPLIVAHELWTPALENVTWPSFQGLVKGARRRLERVD